mmetsp:Transcript_100586/g.322893  ORF Transcript_100586/g.322893 Transcript_100586/m.322893 type:complete len:280 (+) Transcript_100586:120-959(+)
MVSFGRWEVVLQLGLRVHGVLGQGRIEIRRFFPGDLLDEKHDNGDHTPHQTHDHAGVDDGPVRVVQLLHADDDSEDNQGDNPAGDHPLLGAVEIADAERRRKQLVPERRAIRLLRHNVRAADDPRREPQLEALVALHICEEQQASAQQAPLPPLIDGPETIQYNRNHLLDTVREVADNSEGTPSLHKLGALRLSLGPSVPSGGPALHSGPRPGTAEASWSHLPWGRHQQGLRVPWDGDLDEAAQQHRGACSRQHSTAHAGCPPPRRRHVRRLHRKQCPP